MKKYLVGLTVVLLGLFLVVPGVFAYPVEVGDYVKFVDGPGTGQGGSFGVKVKENGSYPGTPNFYSFCLEGNEYINFSSAFYVYDISDTAKNGGNGPSGDPLNPETAYLYTQFALGTIVNNDTNSTALQIAIWAFENEMGYSFYDNNIHNLSGVVISNTLAQDFADAGIAAQWTGIGNVRAMNIKKDSPSGPLAQSQLIYVPEPATLLFLGIGLVGIVITRRRKK